MEVNIYLSQGKQENKTNTNFYTLRLLTLTWEWNVAHIFNCVLLSFWIDISDFNFENLLLSRF